jgi:hypothetical protein
MRRIQPFLNIRTEGALLPSDLLSRLVEGTNLPGLKPEDYHLGAGEKLNEAISRSWTRLLSLWSGFRKAQTALSASDLGTTLTRERWLLQLFQELGYGRLIVASPVEIDGKTYPISHVWQGQYYQVPIHLVSFRADLDKRSEQRIQGASKASPHGMVQEYLNRSEHYLWALASNGLKLLILRDNASLTRQAYVEFDLEGIFDGEAYADFRLLWMLCHQSRLEGTALDRPDTCWLEAWSKQAETEGRRALDQLRIGVQKALENLGTGFIANAANQDLRDRLQAGQLQKQDLYRQLLRLVYRLIFLFVAEDRDLLHFPGASEDARSRYTRFYSGQRLRKMAERTRGSRHADLWVALRLIFGKLGDDRGCSQLGLPALGGFLFGPVAMPDLEAATLSNEHLLQAIRNLGLVKDRSGWRLVDYRNLGSEELGSIYESLLELNPTMEVDAGVFSLGSVAGNQRKTSGSYYTPDSLVQCLLDSALDPVVEEAIRGKSPAEAERAIVALKVCDPAVGSGHFLVGAAHRLANHLARVRAAAQGESEPSPLFHQQALRDVIGRCLYGVDMNPMAAELCRVSLWLEAIEPGKPLSFLDHHIRVGNSLLGATPALLAKGIPDEAFTPIEGDDKEVCSRFKKVNKEERNKQTRLFAATTEPWEQLGNLAASMTRLEAAPDDSIEAVRIKERMYEAMVRSGGYLEGQFWADSWCAAFVWRKTEEFNYPITEEVFRRIERNPHACDAWMRAEIERLAAQYQFFHWHLAFPDVFHVPRSGQITENEQTGWSGGFDVILGNPPWDKVQPEEVKFFDGIRPDIAEAKSASIRKTLIRGLSEESPALAQRWLEYKREIDATCLLLREGGALPLTTEGNLNTYRLFCEISYNLLGSRGFSGMIVQTGMATDESGKEFFAELLSHGRLVRFLDFENKGNFFPDVHAQFRFALLTTCGAQLGSPNRAGEFGWLLHSLDEQHESGRLIHLTSEDLTLFNPASGTCPVFKSERDLLINRELYSHGIHISIDSEHRFGEIDFLGELFNMTRDSDYFISRPDSESEYLPLYEAKYLYQFDHRYAEYRNNDYRETPVASKMDPDCLLIPKSWVSTTEVDRRTLRRKMNKEWMIGFRDVASATNERTAIIAIFPFAAVGNNINLLLALSPEQAALLCANVNSFAFDYACRQKTSGMHVNIFTMKQLPAVPLSAYNLLMFGDGLSAKDFALSRLLELSYTAWDLNAFAADLGHYIPPFGWDEDRRFLLRCELDALYLHLYCIDRDTSDYIMETFPIVRKKDEAAHDGDFRTKRKILEIYDALADSLRLHVPYQTRLDPPPAAPALHHPKKKVGILAFGSLIKDPGPELQPKIDMRISVKTPFRVEYARVSRTRGGAPTLVPHAEGGSVSAQILVMDDDVSVAEASDMLWRRERRQEGTCETYTRGVGENSVLVEEFHEDACVSTVLYTDFNPAGKIAHPTAADLGKRAIESVAKAPEGMDGITYLMNAIASGIETPLTVDYRAEILKQTLSLTLEEALKTVRETR